VQIGNSSGNPHDPRVDSAIFVTTSEFTDGAKRSAKKLGIQLVDGRALVALAREVIPEGG
jgi:restriction endonuclease Mrr